MADYYVAAEQSVPQPETTVTLGPYNSQQAPFMECASCGTPITVGQEFCELKRWKLAMALPYGQLCFWPSDEADRTQNPWEQTSVFFHDECSAEYCHDYVTKEPCGEDCEDENRSCCRCCGAGLDDRSGICDWCESKLRGVAP